MLHVVADCRYKIAMLRLRLEPAYKVTSALLHDESSVPKGCEAAIISVDLKKPDNIAILKQISTGLKGTKRKVYLIDQKARLFAAQAYALGATHVLFNPVKTQRILDALSEHSAFNRLPDEPPTNNVQDALGAAQAGAASLASMFTAAKHGQAIDVVDARRAARNISHAVLEEGFSKWLEIVRRHHEGTYQHCLLVVGTVAAFGLHLGLSAADIERLSSAAMFHDVGKAKVPVAILDKPGRLDPQERAIIETHPVAGFEILKGAGGISSDILDGVRHHHEFLDGSGYPDALCDSSISDLVRILTISDIFAALSEDRSYRPPVPRTQAYEILKGMRGKLESPLVSAFKEVALNS